MDKGKIEAVLIALGEGVPPNSRLLLLGGSALTLLGSPRPSLDIDFVGDDVNPSSLHRAVIEKAKALKLQVDAVPIDRFIPMPEGNEERNIYVGRFANLDVYVLDPYSIALSKVDRGLFTDYDDIVFLVERGYITIQELDRITQQTVARAGKYDLNPDILNHLQELKSRLK